MPEPYDLEKMLKEIIEDERFSPKKTSEKATQEDIREMIRKKRQNGKGIGNK